MEKMEKRMIKGRAISMVPAKDSKGKSRNSNAGEYDSSNKKKGAYNKHKQRVKTVKPSH
jgi:cell fate regulator YaaT (PSP1 superfamily)